jgi:activator of the mannose operon (transcriptional antiterminator)
VIKISTKEIVKKKLLFELLKKRQPVTIAELSQLIEKTGRTVRSYLDELKNEYEEYNLEIVRKTNVGIYLNIDEKSREKLFQGLADDKGSGNKTEDFSSKYRQVYILKTLFEDKFSYTIQMFADELYCSKSTIVKELIEVQNWLESHKISLFKRQNQGIRIEGNEKNLRNALKDFITEMQGQEENAESFYENIEELDYRLDVVNYIKVSSMFPKLDLFYIQHILQEAEKKLEFYFTDQAFLNLITHIAITIERLKTNNAVGDTDSHISSVTDEREYNVAKWLAVELSEKFNISFPQEEIVYMSIHMLGAKIQEGYDVKDSNTIIENQDDKYLDIAKSIIALCSEVLGVDLMKDEGLLTRLLLHLRPTIMRMKYGLRLTNPILERIKVEYTSLFGAAWACSSIFENQLGIAINEDEVGYLALHLALSVDNIKLKIKTIVVCSSGVGTSQLVASKLIKKFDNLEITHVLPYNLLNQKLIDEADLIVTTIQSMKNLEKAVYVTTLLYDEDLDNINKAIKSIKISQRNHISPLNHIEEDCTSKEEQPENIFDRSLCFLDKNITDFIDAITYYGKLMEEKGYAKTGFYQDILNREQKGSTYVGKGIAIPHARNIFVNKSKICIVKFEKPVTWQGNNLEFIFILCLKFNEINTTKKFFKNFYSVLENEEIILKIKNAKNVDDLSCIFNMEVE